MVSLEIRWIRLQRESDNRYRRLVVIHEKLSTFEEVLQPFVVSATLLLIIYRDVVIKLAEVSLFSNHSAKSCDQYARYRHQLFTDKKSTFMLLDYML